MTMRSRKSAWYAFAAATLLVPAPALAQDTRPLVGLWAGDVAETVDDGTVRYRMYVTMDVDRRGVPVAAVHYSLECTSVWTGARHDGRTWRFEETVTSGRANCASHADGVLVAEDGTLRVELHPVGYPEQVARAVLRRTSETSRAPHS
jgi:hypothetical protein